MNVYVQIKTVANYFDLYYQDFTIRTIGIIMIL